MWLLKPSLYSIKPGNEANVCVIGGTVVSGLAVLSPPTEQGDTGRAHGWSKKRQLYLHNGVTCGSHSARRTCRVINAVLFLPESPAG